MSEPLHHIERPSLPWRPERKTCCGLDLDNALSWTRDEARAQARKLGRQRFSMFACMTCTNVFNNTPEWDVDPAGCISDLARRYTVSYYGSDEQRVLQFAAELRAIAMLVEAHRAEFDETVEGLLGTTSLDSARKAKEFGRLRRGQELR